MRPPSMENKEAFDAFLTFITVTATRAARSVPEIVDASPTALWRRRFMFVSMLLRFIKWLDSAASVVETIKEFITSVRYEMASALMQNARSAWRFSRRGTALISSCSQCAQPAVCR